MSPSTPPAILNLAVPGDPKGGFISDDVQLQTKPQIALDQINHATNNGIPVMAWTADELYGRDSVFLDGLDTLGEAFMVEIPIDTRVWLKKPRY